MIREGKAGQVGVKTGMKNGDLVEVTGKVAAGDKLVLRPPAGLRDGAPVTVAAK